MRAPRRRQSDPVPPPDRPTAEQPGQEVGGYRVVRRLGRGPRADVMLGHLVAAPGRAGLDAAGGSQGLRDAPTPVPVTVALKLYRPGTDLAGINRESQALARIAHPHVLTLIDIATSVTGLPCLMVERLPRGSLAQLLVARDELAVGEAVTVLAPLADAVAVLHSRGIAHGAVGTPAVLFRASGAPVLARFGAVELFPEDAPPAILATIPSVAQDLEALGRLATVVLDRVADPGAAALRSWLDQALGVTRTPAVRSRGPVPDGFAAELAERLFALGEGEPIAFPPVGVSAPLRDDTRIPERVAGSRDVPANVSPPPGRVRGGAVADSVTVLAARLWRAAPERLRGVRPRAWIPAVLVAVSVVVAGLLVPGSGGSTSPSGAPTSVSPTSRAQPSEAQPSAATPVPDPAIAGDDPVDALVALVGKREACLAQLSLLCLEGVDQTGSAAMDADIALIRGLEDGSVSAEDAALTVTTPTLVERWGDTAIVDPGAGASPGATSNAQPGNSKPASALMIRGEAGWRVRSWIR